MNGCAKAHELKEYTRIENGETMTNEHEFIEQVKSLKAKVKQMFIYGTGLYARNIYKILKDRDIWIDGFIVTHIEHEEVLYELPVLNADEMLHNPVGVIIGTNSLNRISIMEKLKQSNFNMDFVVQGTDYIEKDTVRYDGTPVMQITTCVGCSVNCKYCPQNLLVSKYYENDKNRSKNMSIHVFEQCLKKLPKDVRIAFCGMSEPFLNPACVSMIKMAHESGRIIELYTTLVGADQEIIEEIVEIPFSYFTLHVADKYEYAHIPVTDKYLKLLEYVINYKRKDGTPLVNMCNAQAEPHKDVAQICDGKYKILTALHDRAGNLQNDNLLKKVTPDGKVVCSLCGTGLNHNNLLPDGTVLLCDFDYGMEHILGNLLEETYENIMSGNEWKKVYAGMSGDLSQNILCRRCSCANSLG